MKKLVVVCSSLLASCLDFSRLGATCDDQTPCGAGYVCVASRCEVTADGGGLGGGATGGGVGGGASGGGVGGGTTGGGVGGGTTGGGVGGGTTGGGVGGGTTGGGVGGGAIGGGVGGGAIGGGVGGGTGGGVGGGAPSYLGQFILTSPLPAGRSGPTLTLLNDGRVLVAGTPGYVNDSDVYLFDRTTGLNGGFTIAGLLDGGSGGLTATLLRDGRVLLAGDDGLSQAHHIFDASKLGTPNVLTTTGLLVERRSTPHALLLPNGNVVLIGSGIGPALRTRSAEVFIPTGDGGFFPTNSSTGARGGSATAVSLADGGVLVMGGYETGPTATAELYLQSLGGFKPTGSMRDARDNATSIRLPDGRVLIAGGRGLDGGELSTAEIYDPSAIAPDGGIGVFRPTGNMNVGRSTPGSALLRNGLVLIVGGADLHPDPPYIVALNSAELFDPQLDGGYGGFTLISGTLNVARDRPTAVTLQTGEVLIVGARDANGFTLPSAELFQ